MPKFLENRLRAEAAKKGLTGKRADHYVFGGMNNLGAMRGSRETALGREMEKKHMADKPKGDHKMAHMEIEVHRDGNGAITGHTVKHHMMPMASKKSAAFMEMPEGEEHMFGPKGEAVGEGMPMMKHVAHHLNMGKEGGFGEPSKMVPAATQSEGAEENEEGADE